MFVGVCFRDGKDVYTVYTPIRTLQWRELVVVKLGDGLRLGSVAEEPYGGKPKGEVVGKVLRKANELDLETNNQNRQKEKEIYSMFKERILEKGLIVRIVDVELYLDRSKMIIYYISEGWQDFRDVVKEAANRFKMWVEVKGIGVRDAAKIVGGMGICGRQTCCSVFLRVFESISVEMARDQSLPPDPSRLTGLCGRLKCCLAYEYDIYKEFLSDLPSIGTSVKTEKGTAQITGYNMMRREAIIQTEEGIIFNVPVDDLKNMG
jgi:cell fate regulator YaaT (PSP1 superfamily)